MMSIETRSRGIEKNMKFNFCDLIEFEIDWKTIGITVAIVCMAFIR